MSSSSQISRAVRQALVLGAVAAAGSLPAVAQEQAAKPVEVETITVTGGPVQIGGRRFLRVGARGHHPLCPVQIGPASLSGKSG